MAYTVEEEPSDWVGGSRKPITYIVYDDTNTGEEKYEYTCYLYVDGAKVFTQSVKPNSNDHGVFQVQRIIDDYLKPTTVNQNSSGDIIKLGYGTGTPFSKNDETFRRVELRFGYKFAGAADEAPTETADVVTGKYLGVIESTIHSAADTYYLDEIDDSGLTEFEQSGVLDPFISVVPRLSASGTIIGGTVRYDQDIQIGQAHLLSFLNVMTSSSQARGPAYIHVGGYESDGTEIFASSIQNTGSTGGEPPTTSNTDDERLLYFGSGARNLTTQTVNSTISTGMGDADLAYYEICSASSATLNSGSQTSAVYRFNINSECKYPVRRLMFKNPFGGWDFYNFNKVSRKEHSIERKSFEKVRGNWDTATTAFTSSTSERGRETLSTKAMVMETLNTDWVDEEWNTFFLALKMSEDVYMIEQKSGADFYMIPVEIEDTDFTFKTGVTDSLFNHTVKIKYSLNHPFSR